MDDYNAVKKELYDAQDKWEEIGEELGLKRPDLKHIKGDNDYKKLGQVVEKWLQRSELNPTWQKLADALREPPVDRDDVAGKIESKYLRQGTE